MFTPNLWGDESQVDKHLAKGAELNLTSFLVFEPGMRITNVFSGLWCQTMKSPLCFCVVCSGVFDLQYLLSGFLARHFNISKIF